MESFDFLGSNVFLIGLLGGVLIVYLVILVQGRVRRKFMHRKKKKIADE